VTAPVAPSVSATTRHLFPPCATLLLVAMLRAAPLLAASGPDSPSLGSPQSQDPPQSSQLGAIEVQATRLGGPGVAPSGSADYAVTQQDILNMPEGEDTALSDVLTQMPGVSIDQNQQIHIRDTEGPQFQYQIDGVMVPLDINTNPPFLSMINPMFIKRIDLLTGVLPARYSYATGGVVDIETRQGCAEPEGGELSILVGQRDTVEPSVVQSGCDGRFSYFVSGLYNQSNTAFSSATPGPTPYHDGTQGGQALGAFGYRVSDATSLEMILSGAANDNQLPNVPGLAPQYTLAGTSGPPSADINSYLNFRDALAMVALKSSPLTNLSWQLAYSFHTIVQAFRPDDAGELIYQGVASTTTHRDLDHTLEGDLTWQVRQHTLQTGFYEGAYSAHIEDSSLVFPVDASGAQTSSVPLSIVNDAHALNRLSGVYVSDLWRWSSRLSADLGLRWDQVSGFTHGSQVDPTINLSFRAAPGTTIHAGFSRNFQVPIFQGISPTAPAAFTGTTAGGPPGAVSPLTEDDYLWDGGLLTHITRSLTLSVDNYYERTRHYLDTGQFSVVPIFAPFNYRNGHMWGSDLGLHYQQGPLSAYTNVTLGRNWQKGVATGQFNFDPSELAFIDSHPILLDHQPLVGLAAGLNAAWRAYTLDIDGEFSSGLRAGCADQEQLPHVLQVNIGLQHSFYVPVIGMVTNRLSVLNVFDRINLIRPAEGIGIFQAAYAPRRTIYYTLTVPL
jgi:outer membrane receptor protein involved in Fe transport